MKQIIYNTKKLNKNNKNCSNNIKKINKNSLLRISNFKKRKR